MAHEFEKVANDPAKIVEVSIRGKKYVEFIHHAIEQMARRGMTEAEVIETLERPDEIKDMPTPEEK